MTDTTTLFRVENATGYGPYNSFSSSGDGDIDAELRALSNRHCDWYTSWTRGIAPGDDAYRYLHPGPTQDPGLQDAWYDIECSERGERGWRFAFESEEKLHDWFHGERDVLERAGMKVVEYRVPADGVHLGEFQAVFDSTMAERIGERPLSAIIDL